MDKQTDLFELQEKKEGEMLGEIAELTESELKELYGRMLPKFPDPRPGDHFGDADQSTPLAGESEDE